MRCRIIALLKVLITSSKQVMIRSREILGDFLVHEPFYLKKTCLLLDLEERMNGQSCSKDIATVVALVLHDCAKALLDSLDFFAIECALSTCCFCFCFGDV